VVGEVLEVEPPELIVFTYGYASGRMIPLGGSRVSIRLEAEPRGTRLHFLHEFAEAAVRDQHVQGWRYQLSLTQWKPRWMRFSNASTASMDGSTFL
jgi:uncharacterized protein YndB with AHSA1/START domain